MICIPVVAATQAEALRMIRESAHLADVLELLAVELIGIVPEDQAVLVSTNRGAPIALEPKSKTGQAFRDVAKRLSGEQVAFSSTDGAGGFLGRISKMIRSGETKRK